jgi:suppressor of fused
VKPISSSAEKAYQKGNQLLMDRSLTEALAEFTKSINKQPDIIEFRLARARCYLALDQYKSALDDYTVAVQIDGDSSLAHFGVGLANQSLDNPAEALYSYSLALTLNPDYKDAGKRRESILRQLARSAAPNGNDSLDTTPEPGNVFNMWKNLYGRKPDHMYTLCAEHADERLRNIGFLQMFLIDRPFPHWHIVSFGMRDLGISIGKNIHQTQKSNELGIELSMRVQKLAPEDNTTPLWVGRLFDYIADYIFKTGSRYEANNTSHIDIKGSTIGGLLMRPDPLIPEIETTKGQLKFIAMYGLTIDELEAVRGWTCKGFAAFVRKQNELFIVDPQRPSLLEDQANNDYIQEMIESEGSSFGELRSSKVSWIAVTDKSNMIVHATLPFSELSLLIKVIPGSIQRGNPFTFKGSTHNLLVYKDIHCGWKVEGKSLKVAINNLLAYNIVESLQEEKAQYSWSALPGLVISTKP